MPYNGYKSTNMKKLEKDGKVAVVYSPGFGAGWSTWNDSDSKEFLCMHAGIIQAVLDKDFEKAKSIAEAEVGNSFYGGGAEDLVVEWLNKGEQFEITEYDGSENINIVGKQSYMIA